MYLYCISISLVSILQICSSAHTLTLPTTLGGFNIYGMESIANIAHPHENHYTASHNTLTQKGLFIHAATGVTLCIMWWYIM